MISIQWYSNFLTVNTVFSGLEYTYISYVSGLLVMPNSRIWELLKLANLFKLKSPIQGFVLTANDNTLIYCEYFYWFITSHLLTLIANLQCFAQPPECVEKTLSNLKDVWNESCYVKLTFELGDKVTDKVTLLHNYHIIIPKS